MKLDITGSAASGKTTLSWQISQKYGVPCYEKDNIIWKNTAQGRIRRNAEERDRIFADILRLDDWVVEGSPRDCLTESFESCDLIIVIDEKTPTRVIYAFKRWLRQRFGIDTFNKEPTVRQLWHILKWIRYFNTMREGLFENLEKYGDKCVIFENIDQAMEYIDRYYSGQKEEKETDKPEFVPLRKGDEEGIAAMSKLAEGIVREHFDPIIGEAQNSYMIEKFNSPAAVKQQLEDGYRYFFVKKDDADIGFIAFYPRGTAMYLSKFYLKKSERGIGYARRMLEFVTEAAKAENLQSVELNVNRNNPVCAIYEKLGFEILREDKKDIGNGFFMDDYLYSLKL